MLLKLHGHGIYSLLITILEKSANTLLRTWQIGVPMNIHDRIIIYGILIPALIIFKTLLQKLTIDRKTKVCYFILLEINFGGCFSRCSSWI
jgi:hypothetical protein